MNKSQSSLIQDVAVRNLYPQQFSDTLRRIVSVSTAEHIINSGKADMVAKGCALIADLGLPKKVLAGELGSIRPCISCNEGCAGGNTCGEWVYCAVNPLAGYEAHYPMAPADTPQKKCCYRRRICWIGSGAYRFSQRA